MERSANNRLATKNLVGPPTCSITKERQFETQNRYALTTSSYQPQQNSPKTICVGAVTHVWFETCHSSTYVRSRGARTDVGFARLDLSSIRQSAGSPVICGWGGRDEQRRHGGRRSGRW